MTGGVLLTVSGAQASERLPLWRSGRLLEAPVTFRRPVRYLTTGAGHAERAAALGGVSLLGRVKSGLAVEVVGLGTAVDEWGAAVRAHVRRRVAGRMGAGTGSAVVTALLIGDRTAIAAAVTERLQAAGTYHVIATSGGGGSSGAEIGERVVAPALRAQGSGLRASVAWMPS